MRKFFAVLCFVCAMAAGVGAVGNYSELQGEPWEKALGALVVIGPLLWLGFWLNKEPKKPEPEEKSPTAK